MTFTFVMSDTAGRGQYKRGSKPPSFGNKNKFCERNTNPPKSREFIVETFLSRRNFTWHPSETEKPLHATRQLATMMGSEGRASVKPLLVTSPDVR